MSAGADAAKGFAGLAFVGGGAAATLSDPDGYAVSVTQ